MFKVSHTVEDNFIEYSHAPVMQREPLSSNSERIAAGVPTGDSTVLSALLNCLEEPFFLLYVLHTPRGEAAPGRYQSPELSKQEALNFISRFSKYLGQDARHDFWVRSNESNATIVWDRHNLIYAYGPVPAYGSALFRLGFSHGKPVIPAPYCHHYREEFDKDAQVILAYHEWKYSELRPEDEQ